MLKLFEESVIEEDIFAKSVQRYQLAVQEAKLRLDFAIAPDIWLMPSNLIINTDSVIGYNNFLLKANKDMTFGENKLLNNKIKKVGIDHNLGASKINQHIVKTDDSVDQVHNFVAAQMKTAKPQRSRNHNINSDNNDKVGINKQPSVGSSHDLKKATAIIVAAVVGYMMFR